MERRLISRLTKKEKAKNIRRTVTFGFLSLILILAILYFGLPALVKLSIFLGNIRSSSLVPETEDKIPPAIPEIFPPTEATSSSRIKLVGFAEPGSKIEIFINGVSRKTVVADSDGNFSFDNLDITEGENEIYATSTDKAGNTSQPSKKTVIILDKTPPQLNIFQPDDKTTFYGKKTVEIKGETEEEAAVTVNGYLAIMETGGKFSYSLNLSTGENKIKIITTDKAGNQTEKELTVFLE